MNQPDSPQSTAPTDAGAFDFAGLYQLINVRAGEAGEFRGGRKAKEFRLDALSL